MNEKYHNASINFLKELYKREDSESQKLKRKREISRSRDYNDKIRNHEWNKKLIEYLIVSTCSFNQIVTSYGSCESGMEDKHEGRREAYLELVRDKVISLQEAESWLNVSEEELESKS